MKNLNFYMTMALIAMVQANQLLSSGANTASIASAETAVIHQPETSSIAGSQTMGLASEFSSAATPMSPVTSIDGGNVATPSAPTPVESATLLTDTSASQQVMPGEQPAQESQASVVPTVAQAQTEKECAWNSMGCCVRTALVKMYRAACDGVTAVKNMIW